MHPMKFSIPEFFMFAFAAALITFIVVYLVIWIVTVICLLFKKRTWKGGAHAFYITLIVLFANNIFAFITGLIIILFDKELLPFEGAIVYLIAAGTTPFFIILLLTWLSIKARDRRRSVKKEELEIGKTGEDWLR